MENENQTTPKEPTTEVTAPQATEPVNETKFSFDQKSLVAAASYVGPLIIIPFLTAKEDPFTQFHIKQGILVFAPGLVVWLFSGFMYGLYPVVMIINLALLILSVIGVVNVLQGKEKALPFIGHLSAKINL
jgi:uncharacterized membrane protein